MGLDSMLFPFMAIAFYAIFARPPHAKPIAVTGFICALAVFFLWQIDHKIVLFSKYGTIDFSRAGLLIAGSFPWVLLLPQAVLGAMKNRREFFRRRSVDLSDACMVAYRLSVSFRLKGKLPLLANCPMKHFRELVMDRFQRDPKRNIVGIPAL